MSSEYAINRYQQSKQKERGIFVFYDVFSELCEKRGTSPIEVRKELGISQSTMASWKSRGLTPNATTIARLAEYFNVSVDYLLGKDNCSASISKHSSDIAVLLLNILNLSPQDQENFDKNLELFNRSQKGICELMQDESFTQKISSALTDELYQQLFPSLIALCRSLEKLNNINPEGIYQLRSQYSRWNDDVTLFNKVRSQLNEMGRREALKRMQEVAEIPRYKQQPNQE